MSASSIRQVILDLAVDDSFALSEIVSRVRQEQAELSASEAKQLARKNVEEMLELGLVEVTRLENPSDAELPLDRDAAKIALMDDLSWLPSTHWRAHVRVVATAAGREAYYGTR